MAHQLKYYKEIDSHGHLWRVEILQETEDVLTPMEIGPVLQSLRLVLQGDQADIDTPIVKTSLEMTFVDAPDHEEERKCGYWEEFYTSSATEYQVRLYKDGAIEWTGYVTPDSFSEDLRYRGSVSIIARDNLGALQDYICDAEPDTDGFLSIFALIESAKEKVSFGMSIYDDHNMHHIWPECIEAKPRSLYHVRFNAAFSKGKNYWEVLEQALYSMGVILRYIGGNIFVLQPIRCLGLTNRDFWADIPVKPAIFKAFGHRELSPAVKYVKDIIDFDINDKFVDIEVDAEDYGEQGTLKCYDSDEYYNISNPQDAPVYSYSTPGAGLHRSNVESSRILNQFAYPINIEHNASDFPYIHSSDTLYVLCNTFVEGSYKMAKTNPVISTCVIQELGTYSIQPLLTFPICIYGQTVGKFDTYGNVAPVYIAGFACAARWDDIEGNTRYLIEKPRSGPGWPEYSWSDKEPDALVELYGINEGSEYDMSCAAIPDLDVTVPGTIRIEFYGAVIQRSDLRAQGSLGCYIGFKGYDIQCKSEYPRVMDSRTVVTQYKNTNNIILHRNPSYGCNPSRITNPIFVRNGMYIRERVSNLFKGSDQWVFHDTDTPLPLTALIHQQILAYYAKPNNVLTGELILEDDVPDFGSLWRWGGKDHLLMSGTLNVLTGRMENAVLREFKRYDHIWETWVENEDIDMDYPAGRMTFVVHSNKDLDQDAWKNVPSWVSPRGHIEVEDNLFLFDCDIMANASGQTRSAIFQIDTAYVRITQRAAGDYGIDYGKDYS